MSSARSGLEADGEVRLGGTYVIRNCSLLFNHIVMK